MSIKTGDNFLYRGKKPLDSRDSFDTILSMTTFAESSLDEGHISYVKETDKHYKFNSTNIVDPVLGKWREYSGSGSATDEKVKLDSSSSTSKYLNEWIDNSTIEVDTPNNCLVVKKIDGQTVTVAEINFLTGVTSNIQTQLNNLGKSMTMYGVFATKGDLLASATPVPVDGNTAIVVADEDNDNKQMTYIYIASTSSWTQVAESSVTLRDFSTNPIDLSSETTGVLPESRIDAAVARLADVLDKATYKGSSDGVVKQADTITGLISTIAALNQAITDSHAHSNKSTLDNIVSSGIGSGFLADNGRYISILHIGSNQPVYDSQIWIDTSDSTAPVLKIFDGTSWIAVSGSSSGDGKSAYELAVENGFVGTEEEWLESLKGEPGKDGRSIASITKDNNNNIIVTFSDGTIQNIGQLNIDVQADFLTETGFGNLRYYNGVLQYYNTNTSSWVDTSITPENVYIMNMIPQPMQKISCVFDTNLYKYKLKWQEPADTIIDGQVACLVDKVIIRRKLGSVPTDENDGDLVIEVKRKDFNSYKSVYFIDEELTPSEGDVYYYKAFPVSTTGFYNYSTVNETSGTKYKNYNLYGFKIDQNESDPASMITYIEDNKEFAPAYMDYTADDFNYGDWGDIWFIKNLKPCMLKYDGTVDYELDKNDYTKKIDGTDSDIANDSYGGNAMVGIPKVYWKIVDNGDNTANVYFSDKKLDEDFHCWSHLDNNGNEIEYCYMPIYNGSNVNSRLRSLSGRSPIYSQRATTEITYAKANNLTNDIIWYTEVYCDRVLINLLLMLIGKSTNTQAVFGNGRCTESSGASYLISSGTLDEKGLFYGSNVTSKAVKVFGMENWWGNVWRRIAGLINDKGTQKVKLTYGQSDSSTTDGYNTDGTGYISIDNSTPSGANGGHIRKMLITDNGLMPLFSGGSATTYYCDVLWFNTSQVNYAAVGGDNSNSYGVGAFGVHYNAAVSYSGWGVGAAISCKPLAPTS